MFLSVLNATCNAAALQRYSCNAAARQLAPAGTPLIGFYLMDPAPPSSPARPLVICDLYLFATS